MIPFLFKAGLMDIYGKPIPILNEEFWLLLESNRNIVNVDDVDEFINDVLENEVPPKVAKWVKSNLRNYLLREYEHLTKLELDPENERDLKHIKDVYPDWVLKALIDKKELQKIDLYEVPGALFDTASAFFRKIEQVLDYLSSIQDELNIDRISVPEAIRQSDKWHEEFKKKKVKSSNEEAGTETVKEYPNGYRWVKVLAKDCLDREGAAMGHCVGSYADRVSGGYTTIYSLRDEKNEPHITLEYSGTTIRQIKGKQNRPPDKKYHEYVVDFIKKPIGGMSIGDISSYDNVYGVVKVNGTWASPEEISKMEKPVIGAALNWPIEYELPEGTTISGTLTVSEGAKIPDGIVARSIVSSGNIESIGDNVTVERFESVPVKKIGKNLKVAEDLVFHPVTEEIGDGLSVGGSFKNSEYNESNLKKFPKIFEIGRSIRLHKTKVKSLGVSSLVVGGDFIIDGSKLFSELPATLSVKRSLSCNGCESLKDFSKKLKIGKDLNLSGTKVKSLPKRLRVPNNLKVPITCTELSEELNVGGNFSIPSKVSKYPLKLKVTGSIWADDDTVSKKLHSLEIRRNKVDKVDKDDE